MRRMNIGLLRATNGSTIVPPARPRNSRRRMSIPKCRRRHRSGSEECFDRGRNLFQRFARSKPSSRIFMGVWRQAALARATVVFA